MKSVTNKLLVEYVLQGIQTVSLHFEEWYQSTEIEHQRHLEQRTKSSPWTSVQNEAVRQQLERITAREELDEVRLNRRFEYAMRIKHLEMLIVAFTRAESLRDVRLEVQREAKDLLLHAYVRETASIMSHHSRLRPGPPLPHDEIAERGKTITIYLTALMALGTASKPIDKYYPFDF